MRAEHADEGAQGLPIFPVKREVGDELIWDDRVDPLEEDGLTRGALTAEEGKISHHRELVGMLRGQVLRKDDL